MAPLASDFLLVIQDTKTSQGTHAELTTSSRKAGGTTLLGWKKGPQQKKRPLSLTVFFLENVENTGAPKKRRKKSQEGELILGKAQVNGLDEGPDAPIHPQRGHQPLLIQRRNPEGLGCFMQKKINKNGDWYRHRGRSRYLINLKGIPLMSHKVAIQPHFRPCGSDTLETARIKHFQIIHNMHGYYQHKGSILKGCNMLRLNKHGPKPYVFSIHIVCSL